MIKAVAIDDERNALEIVETYAAQISDLNLCRCFSDPVEGLAYLHNNQDIQLVFLDIRMAKLNGLSLAAQLPKNIRVVLTTAYGDYAVTGFDLGALDYLLKPFSFERFERSIDKIRMLAHFLNPAESEVPLKKIAPSHDDIILVKADLKIIKVRLNELMYVEGAGNYLTLHMPNRKILVHSTMRVFEEKLMPYQFVRIHKSYIVSFLHVDSIDKLTAMVGGNELPISESYKPALNLFLSTHFNQI